MNPNQIPPQLQIRPDQATDIHCSECGHDVFIQGVKFKKVSKVLTATPTDQIIPIPSQFQCMACGAVLDLNTVVNGKTSGESDSAPNTKSGLII